VAADNIAQSRPGFGCAQIKIGFNNCEANLPENHFGNPVHIHIFTLSEALDPHRFAAPIQGGYIMPASYHFLTRSVQIDVQGILTVREVLQAMRGIMQDAQAHQGIDLICDLRNANAEAVVTNKIRSGAEPIARLLPFFNNRIHLVVSTSVQFGFTRMYQTYSSDYGVDVLIYKSIEEAYQCLKEPCEQESEII
jgi:hypothetical protein